MRELSRPRSVWELIPRQDSHLEELHSIVGELLKQGYLEVKEGKLSLTPKGRDLARDLGISHRREGFFETARTRCVTLVSFLPEMKIYEMIASRRPPIRAEFDQGYMRAKDVFFRLVVMYERGDLEGAEIAVLGDDDLLGIALALTGLPRKVEVFEVDENIVEFENRVARQRDLKLEAHVYDFRRKLDERWLSGFDTFVTDPVETIHGLKLTFSRGAAMLRDGGSGYFGLTRLESSLAKWREVQRMLNEMNFAITDLYPNFSVYPLEGNIGSYLESCEVYRAFSSLSWPPDADFYTSHLYRIEAVGRPKPLVAPDEEMMEDILHDEESWVTP